MRLWPRRNQRTAVEDIGASADERLAAAHDLAAQVRARQAIVDRQHRESERLARQNSFGSLMRDALTGSND